MGVTMQTADILKGPLPDAKVGIGCASGNDNSARSAAAFRDVTVYTDPDALTDDLRSGRIDAAVRGDMSSSVLLPKLRTVFGLKELQRVVILEPMEKKMVFMAPVGIDEGMTVRQRYELAEGSIRLMRKLGMNERIAVMSGGSEDDRGRNPSVDRTIDDALELVGLLRKDGYDAYHAQILIEAAADDADLIIAPDGITGNIIFRTLHLLGGAKALGAPVMNMDRVFVDTSRAKTDYRDSIALAKRLTEGMK
jgi:putative methanogen marker protein 4